MPRRRYRLFTVCAVILVFLFYRVLENSWTLSNRPDSLSSVDNPPKIPDQPGTKGDGSDVEDVIEMPNKFSPGLLGDEQAIEKALEDESEHDAKTDDRLKEDSTTQDKLKEDTLKDDPAVEDTPQKDTSNINTSKGSSKHASPEDLSTNDSSADEDIEPVDDDLPEIPNVHWSDRPIHDHSLDHVTEGDNVQKDRWVKPKENFPLPPGSITPIPTGAPKKIPKIQYEFEAESERTKNKRLQRQGLVKAELERAWSGYRKHAWMHDELSPVSKSHRDPFCGWAATLVDSLDTLWIADMRDEFDEAANAVADIDFRSTPRSDIPVFETTIRYLGGLIAAYDVSGGPKSKYPVLLNKAVELAEILMGIFDTPNRMPILYYHWRPPYSSAPHRASVVGIAELATLSLEFTRLAQLTGTAKYYDAVNRITDALVKMQEEGHTHIPGLFPESIDASGCNKTATDIRNNLSKEAQKQTASDGKATAGKSFVRESDTNELNARADIPPPGPDVDERESLVTDGSYAPVDAPLSTEGDMPPVDSSQKETSALNADGSHSEWDCVPQGLTRTSWGGGTYHMSGAQDSAYEYFPKQYLLLGGLESKYKKLHVDAISAINKHLLYRPMIKHNGDWDILFTGKISTYIPEVPSFPTSYEIAHLACFIGGMYGLGGKIFNRPDDVEVAKQLTDGCVWAYQSTTTGIMPEAAQVAPCPTLEKCKFNQTLWYELLDPAKVWRDNELQRWEEEEAYRERAMEKKEKLREKAREKAKVEVSQDEDIEYTSKEVESKHSKQKPDSKGSKHSYLDNTSQDDVTLDEKTLVKTSDETLDDGTLDGDELGDDTLDDDKPDDETLLDRASQNRGGTKSKYSEYEDKSIEYESAEEEASEEKTARNMAVVDKSPSDTSSDDLDTDSEPELKARDAISGEESSHLHKRHGIPMPELDTAMSAPKGESGSELPDSLKEKLGKDNRWKDDKVKDEKVKDEKVKDEMVKDEKVKDEKAREDESEAEDAAILSEIRRPKPKTHEEFVKEKLERQPWPPGITNVGSSNYILRPEAIESVWYMYRITGDPEWQEKGWAMFEATIKAVRAESAHSAISNVFSSTPATTDSMESFWTAETLKYYYLLFSEPDLISLDEWVLNTEAHPFKLPTPAPASTKEPLSEEE
ncbi:glycosyl hydrolase family 47-domain-containing protein [Mariannaea sp. PMI_226]|nr:glycosyl hydrolase family 47-domain-containing protein [Mariannaea sp. PMI_226]